MALIVIDLLGWVFNGKPGSLCLSLNVGFNLLLYITMPLAPLVWVLYSRFQVFHDETQIGKLKYPLFTLFSLNAVATVLSLETGWYFYVTPDNIYHRGEYFWIYVLFCYSILFYSLLFIIFNKARLEKSHYIALLVFSFPQLAGSIIQIFFYGTSSNWSGMMLSILIVYFYIQDRGLNTDYLTGVYNRRQLDYYVRKKIRESAKNKSFSAILIDLNNFKQINDTLGHDVGDEALRNAVKIIRTCLRRNDFIARYGGDEFYIILDVDDLNLLESAVNRIHHTVRKFNSDSNHPYRLSFCMGYDVYRFEDKLKSDDFLKHIDVLMYRNKELMRNGHDITEFLNQLPVF
jgi:diguanylate cyclase (GGDEF)-like protein